MDGSVPAALAKIEDGFLICGLTIIVDSVAELLRKLVTLGIVINGPGIPRYFSLCISQHKVHTITINGDYILNGIGS